MIKPRNKEEKRTLEQRGKEKYQFDLKAELNIYSYLWCAKGYEQLEIDDNEKFDTYRQWKSYVESKHSDCNKEDLIEFSKYLNQRLRNLKPKKEYNGVVIAVIIALVVDKLHDLITDIIDIAETVPNPIAGSCIVVIPFIILLVICVPLLLNFLLPIEKDEIMTNLLIDYKEIIDEKINNITK